MRRPQVAVRVAPAILFLSFWPLFAALSIYVPPEGLARIAPVVVDGQVERVASGYDPETGSLATYVTIAVETVHRGPAELDEIVLREPGGRFGSLVHELDAVPVYEVGERVLVFVELSRDGAPRTAGMFFGKFTVREASTRDGDRAVRDLSGQGLIQRRPEAESEDLPLRDLLAVLENHPYGASSDTRPAMRRLRAGRSGTRNALAPPELDRVLWDEGLAQEPESDLVACDDDGSLSLLGVSGAEPAPAPLFTPLSSTYPARWQESDSGTAIVANIEQARNPLNDGPEAAYEMTRAMAAWTNVPEGRIALQCGNDNYNFTGTVAQSPADAYPPVNILLFGDPYDDMTDPTNCTGTLAIGGYWRSGTIGRTVNNVTFYPELRLYVIFNNDFECFFGIPGNLAEVATHELGHGIGFGHSTVYDAIMRSYAYGSGRGPRLGEDDRDAAHCHYPHTLGVIAPNGGESWTAGTLHAVTWSATSESGPDPGTVSLEYSTDSGAHWISIASGEPNDGTYSWTVPSAPGTHARVRVLRPNRVSPTPSPYPSACSSDASNGDFTIVAAALEAGTVPGAAPATPVRVARSGSDLTLTWGPSCAATATDYAIYEGTLTALRSGSFDHEPVTCSAGTDFTQTFLPGTGNRYYLVAPRAGSNEGSLGRNSSGTLRPASAEACAPREAVSCQ